jgi:hypothetical protein
MRSTPTYSCAILQKFAQRHIFSCELSINFCLKWWVKIENTKNRAYFKTKKVLVLIRSLSFSLNEQKMVKNVKLSCITRLTPVRRILFKIKILVTIFLVHKSSKCPASQLLSRAND